MKYHQNKTIELLAPAGNQEKFLTALHFGADAVYLSGKNFGLRAFADNFDNAQLFEAVQFAHKNGKKVYVTVNIFASNSDFGELKDYLVYLESINVDAVLMSDPGVIDFCRKVAPKLVIHLSTQANTVNKYAVKFWYEQGVKRIVLARECSCTEIEEICQFVPSAEIEIFVHGAMCVSYSGRCLMSNYLTGRNANRGECVQSCRWVWKIEEEQHTDNPFFLQQDPRGTYVFNSKDLNLLSYIKELSLTGADSFKIEGRMKSVHYVATVINAYRRALDLFYADRQNYCLPEQLYAEPFKTVHREFTTGFVFDDGQVKQNVLSGKATSDNSFVAVVVDSKDGVVCVEMRNRFCEGSQLSILSNNDSFGKTITVKNLRDTNGTKIEDAKVVQKNYLFDCPYPLSKNDILRF